MPIGKRKQIKSLKEEMKPRKCMQEGPSTFEGMQDCFHMAGAEAGHLAKDWRYFRMVVMKATYV